VNSGASGIHPQIAPLLKQYARELAQVTSPSLDARIDQMVAAHRARPANPAHPRRNTVFYAAAAGLAALAIGIGIFIGVRLEQSRRLAAHSPRDAAWPPADLSMWPTDSVSLKIPAEYSAQGTLVAVDPNSKHGATRYWIDVVVANDGTFRIERIVPAETVQKNSRKDHEPQTP
jgi:hypothetical protein